MSTLSPEAALVPVETAPLPQSVELPLFRRALVFGTGFGIVIGERNLEAAIVRARPSGPALLAAATIRDFRNRPAAEWGAELLGFVADSKETRLAATVVLPRSEVIARAIHLPGVADKDIPAAIELQIDTLHPWGDTEVAWGWSRAKRGASSLKNEKASHDTVLIGITRKEILAGWETLFAEAGIPLAAVTFSSAVLHAALRFWREAPPALLGFTTENGKVEIYGESEARPVFSAEFSLAPERAVSLARAEMRIAPDLPAVPLSEMLPGVPSGCQPLAYASAIAGAVPRLASIANLLPPERRESHNRVQYLLPGTLGLLVVVGLVLVFLVFPALEQRRYKADLAQATRQLEPVALRAQNLERKTAAARARTAMLDDIRRRPQADLDVLNELTRLLPPPIWTSSIEIYPDNVVISGEADQAAPLLKIIDASPLFQNSEFSLSVTRASQTEQFRIKTFRRGRIGRTTP